MIVGGVEGGHGMADGQMTAAAFLIAELRRARARRGWSQDELAKAVNYSASMVSAVELGQQPPTAKYLELDDRALDTGGPLRPDVHRIGQPRPGRALAAGPAGDFRAGARRSGW